MPGRPKNWVPAIRPDREGAARLHGHLPEVDASDLAQHALDEVVVADRDAAGGEHDVRRAGGLRAGARGGRSRTSGTMPRSSGSAPGALDHRRRARSGSRRRSAPAAAGGPAPPPRRPWRGAPRADAGGPRTSAKPSDATRPRSCGRSTEPARSTTAPGPDVLAAGAHVRSGLDRAEVDPVPRALAELLGHDGVRPARHRRAGHDPERLAGSDAARVDRARGKIADDAKRARGPRDEVRRAHGVAVDGGVVRGRDVEGSRDVPRQDAPEPARDRKRLLRRRGRHVGEDAGPGVRDGDHGGARYYTGRSAIVAAPMDDAREWTATAPRRAADAPAVIQPGDPWGAPVWAPDRAAPPSRSRTPRVACPAGVRRRGAALVVDLAARGVLLVRSAAARGRRSPRSPRASTSSRRPSA